MRRVALVLFCVLSSTLASHGQESAAKALIRDIASVQGVRDNPLLGYGIVVGLNGTGDCQQTMSTIQACQHTRAHGPADSYRHRSGQKRGCSLRNRKPASVCAARNAGRCYRFVDWRREKSGRWVVAIDTALWRGWRSLRRRAGASHSWRLQRRRIRQRETGEPPDVGIISGGGRVEPGITVDLQRQEILSLLLSQPDFSTAEEVAGAINRDFGHEIASAADSRRIESGPARLVRLAFPPSWRASKTFPSAYAAKRGW